MHKIGTAMFLGLAIFASGWFSNAELHPQKTVLLHAGGGMQNAEIVPWRGALVYAESGDTFLRNVDLTNSNLLLSVPVK